jgi:predicted heme/steroid binding protein
MKDFDVKSGPAGVGYRQHDGHVVLVQGAYRREDGTLSNQRDAGPLAYDAFTKLPDAVAVVEGIKAE